MPSRRIFLDWNKPCLSAAIPHLLERGGKDPLCDLSHCTVVLPVSRAGRRLVEILLRRCEEEGRTLAPPRLVTLGEFPELLYAPHYPVASSVTRLLSWSKALKQTDREALSEVLFNLPPADDEARWWALAERFPTLWGEVAGAGLLFNEVAKRGEALVGFDEEERWALFHTIHQRYLAILKEEGVSDLQMNRLEALKSESLPLEGPLFIIGAADLNPLFKGFLSKIRGDLSILVHAPESDAPYFDEFGALVKSEWQFRKLDIQDERISVVGDPEAQAEAVLNPLRGLKGRFSLDEVTIGLGDESIATAIVERLKEESIPCRPAAGRPMIELPPLTLLRSLGNYLRTKRFKALSALLRHPDMEKVVGVAWQKKFTEEIPDIASTFDEYFNRRLPQRLIVTRANVDERDEKILRIKEIVDEVVRPFNDESRPLSDWLGVVSGFLVQVYGGEGEADLTPEYAELFQAVAGLFDECLETSNRLVGRLSASDALSLLFKILGDRAISPDATESAIEVLGWLELQLDDAPCLVVSGMNEGMVPGVINSDPFLPNSLRSVLGILDNEGRYARDLYALSAMSASKEELFLIAGRVSFAGEPLVVSRLLFAGSEERMASRIARYYDDAALIATPRIWRGIAKPGRGIQLPPPAEPIEGEIQKLSVTAFKDYISCPYYFYLRHVKRVRALRDSAVEMDHLLFGIFVHGTLQRFGNGEVRDATSEKIILEFIEDALAAEFQSRFGGDPLPAVHLQRLQVRERLRAFARWQAEWASSGWKIARIEYAPSREGSILVVDDTPLQITGTLDRIDKHPDGSVCIFDYKSGDAGVDPRKTHLGAKGRWKDLQLPLYEKLVRGDNALGIKDPILVKSGYILLPRDLAKTGAKFGDWNPDELAGAYEEAERIVRNIRDQKFEPKRGFSPPAEFQVLYGHGQLQGEDLESEYGEDE